MMVPRALNDTKKIRKAGADIFRARTIKKIVSAWGGYVWSVYTSLNSRIHPRFHPQIQLPNGGEPIVLLVVWVYYIWTTGRKKGNQGISRIISFLKEHERKMKGKRKFRISFFLVGDSQTSKHVFWKVYTWLGVWKPGPCFSPSRSNLGLVSSRLARFVWNREI